MSRVEDSGVKDGSWWRLHNVEFCEHKQARDGDSKSTARLTFIDCLEGLRSITSTSSFSTADSLTLGDPIRGDPAALNTSISSLSIKLSSPLPNFSPFPFRQLNNSSSEMSILLLSLFPANDRFALSAKSGIDDFLRIAVVAEAEVDGRRVGVSGRG